MSETNLAEALEFTANLAQKAAGAADKVRELILDGLPENWVCLVKADGTFDFQTMPDPLRKHVLGSVDDVVSFVQILQGPRPIARIETRDATGTEHPAAQAESQTAVATPVVWYDHESICVVIDDSTRVDFARMPLVLSPQFVKICQLEKKREEMSQRDFRRLLRVDLAGCFQTSELLDYVSAVKFTTGQTSQAVMGRNKESMGLDVQAEVNDGRDCPDFVELSIPVFDNVGLRGITYRLKAAFEVDVVGQKFLLMPVPMSAQDVLDRAVSDVGQILMGVLDCPIFRGRFE